MKGEENAEEKLANDSADTVAGKAANNARKGKPEK